MATLAIIRCNLLARASIRMEWLEFFHFRMKWFHIQCITDLHFFQKCIRKFHLFGNRIAIAQQSRDSTRNLSHKHKQMKHKKILLFFFSFSSLFSLVHPIWRASYKTMEREKNISEKERKTFKNTYLFKILPVYVQSFVQQQWLSLESIAQKGSYSKHTGLNQA